MKFDVSILTIETIIAINYENLHDTIAINFVANLINFAFNFARNFNDFIVVNFNINAKKMLFV